MIGGVGIDLVDVARVRSILERRKERFLSRVYTDGECAYCDRQKEPAIHYAARFAAKESCLKALGLGVGRVSWKEIEVVSTPSGEPILRLAGKAEEVFREKRIKNLSLSLSHTRAQAMAVVIAEVAQS